MKISIPTIELSQKEWDETCELLKAEYGYTTRAECREHFQQDVKTYGDYLSQKYSQHFEDYNCL
tara:strand:+ start:104 stop:295 length:192 start_codon:yes stop_codon:yes gene_type:complete